MGISLLITYHNERNLLTDCLESVYNQEVLPDEVVVYNDASDFPARDYMIYKEGLSVRLVEGRSNVMLAGARNNLMKVASEEYVHYQDADDLLDPKCFKILKQRISNRPDLIINEVRSISFETGVEIAPAVIGIRDFGSKSELLNFAILGSLLAPSTTFKKEFAIKLGGYKAGILTQCEDFEFNIRLAYYANTISYVKEPIIIQRVRKGSMSHNKPELYTEAIKALEMLSRELPVEFREVVGVRINRLGRQLFHLGMLRESEAAFIKSRQFSIKPMATENSMYILVAGFLGQINAERIATFYRKMKSLVSAVRE